MNKKNFWEGKTKRKLVLVYGCLYWGLVTATLSILLITLLFMAGGIVIDLKRMVIIAYPLFLLGGWLWGEAMWFWAKQQLKANGKRLNNDGTVEEIEKA